MKSYFFEIIPSKIVLSLSAALQNPGNIDDCGMRDGDPFVDFGSHAQTGLRHCPRAFSAHESANGLGSTSVVPVDPISHIYPLAVAACGLCKENARHMARFGKTIRMHNRAIAGNCNCPHGFSMHWPPHGQRSQDRCLERAMRTVRGWVDTKP